MKNIIQNSFGISLQILELFQLYTPHKPNFLRKVVSFIFCISLTSIVPVFGALYIFLGKNTIGRRAADNAYVVTGMWCYAPKLWQFLIKRSEIQECILYFKNSKFVTLRKNQTIILETQIKICRRNTKLFVTSMVIAAAVWPAIPFILHDHNLPVDLWLPFDASKDLRVYYVVYGVVSTGVMYSVMANGAMDPLIAGLICLATGHFRVLKDSLQHLYEYTKEDLEKQELKISSEQVYESNLIYKKIQDCVKHHNAILQFAYNYEASFSFIVFNQFLWSILLLCSLCLQLSMLEPFSLQFLQAFTYFTLVAIEIYFYCYYGTMLYEESNTLCEAVYMSNWYNYDIKSRKALILLMERSKRPTVVTAGKILDLSLETFTTILRRSYSLLAVLKNQ